MNPLFFIILIPVLIAVFTAIFQWLWNTTMPEVFGLKEITFWPALRLLIIASLLFGAGVGIRSGHSNTGKAIKQSTMLNSQSVVLQANSK